MDKKKEIITDKNHILITTSDEIIDLLIHTFVDNECELSKEGSITALNWMMGALSRSVMILTSHCRMSLSDELGFIDDICDNMKENIRNMRKKKD